ncbi:hypothetical protein V6N11_044945 [Hibiscus sabdariffa]|uniref:RRM domain-containing protein n=1 Tax=Hibiscus sabdariffa TaxID=183260 RepID=A0ABR2PUE7_9ROSI
MYQKESSSTVDMRWSSKDLRSFPGRRVDDCRFSNRDSAGQNGEYSAFIDNLSKRVSRRSLWELFSLHGKVTRVFIPFRNNRPRYKEVTFAFVRFENNDDLLNAILKTNGSKIDGKVVRVSKARFVLGRLDRGILRQNPCDSGVQNPTSSQVGVSLNRKVSFKAFRDSRSYLNVLQGVPKLNTTMENPLAPVSHHGDKAICGVAEQEPGACKDRLLDFNIPASKMMWLSA